VSVQLNSASSSASADRVRSILEEFLGSYARRPVPGQGLAQRLGRIVPQSIRPTVRRIATDAVAPMERRRALRMMRTRDLRLNLGCGSLALPGWINVDLLGLPVDLAWNLSRPLPFPNNSVSAIFHEHVLEHLPASAGYEFLRECHRIMKPGAVMRAAIPDAAKYIRSYCDPQHAFLNSWRQLKERGLPTLLGLQEEFYGFGHRTIYDAETFEYFCVAAGFGAVEHRAFGESRLEPCPDSEWRKTDSFYADVIK
jgi:predicted SAM-dependent methyltransferase